MFISNFISCKLLCRGTSARMGDHLWTGKPSRYVTSQLGRLSLLPSVGRENEYQLSGWVIIINGDGGCSFWQPVHADSQPKSSGMVLGRRLLGAVLHSSNEPGELSQWLCHDDSTINIVLDIIIIINVIYQVVWSERVREWAPHSPSWCGVQSWRECAWVQEAERRWRDQSGLEASTCRSCPRSVDAHLAINTQTQTSLSSEYMSHLSYRRAVINVTSMARWYTYAKIEYVSVCTAPVLLADYVTTGNGLKNGVHCGL